MGIAENSRFDLRTHFILQDCYMVLGRSSCRSQCVGQMQEGIS